MILRTSICPQTLLHTCNRTNLILQALMGAWWGYTNQPNPEAIHAAFGAGGAGEGC